MIHPVRLDENHKYWTPRRDGELQVPGYSEICAAIGVTKPNPHHTEAGRVRGTAVHVWSSHIAQGLPTPYEPEERIKNRVDAFRVFLEHSKFVLVGTEKPRYDPMLNFACSPDLWGNIGLWTYVLDLKTGAKRKTDPLQTAAQTIALGINEFRAQRRGCVYIKDRHKIDHHNDPDDLTRWQALVRGYHAMDADQRIVFANEEFPLKHEVFKTMTDAQRRIISNAHAARSFYL